MVTELSATEREARAEISRLKDKLRAAEKKVARRDAKICNLEELFADLNEKRLLEKEPSDIVSQYFQGKLSNLFLFVCH